MSVAFKSAVDDAVLDELRAITGDPNRVLPNLSSRVNRTRVPAPFPVHRWADHMPDVAVLPTSAEEVSEIVKLANRLGIPVVPRAGGTGLSDGAVPLRGGILVDVKLMNQIHEVDLLDRTVTVGPGINMIKLNEQLKHHGVFYPDDPASYPCSLVGGRIGTGGWSLLGARFGHTRENVVSMQVVLPTGEIAEIGDGGGRKLRKSSTAFNLKQLFTGHQGTLGICTEATLELAPRPEVEFAAFFAFEDYAGAWETTGVLAQCGLATLAGVVLFDEWKINYLRRDDEAYIEQPASVRAVVAVAMYGRRVEVEPASKVVMQLGRSKGGKYLGDEISSGDWASRHDRYAIPLHGRSKAGQAVPMSWHCEDAALNYSALPQVREEWHAIVARYRERYEIFDDWGMFAYTNGPYKPWADYLVEIDVGIWEQRLDEENWSAWVDCKREIAEVSLEYGGSITACHGATRAGDAELVPTEMGSAWPVVKAIKRALDPNNVMNPGKQCLTRPTNEHLPTGRAARRPRRAPDQRLRRDALRARLRGRPLADGADRAAAIPGVGHPADRGRPLGLPGLDARPLRRRGAARGRGERNHHGGGVTCAGASACSRTIRCRNASTRSSTADQLGFYAAYSVDETWHKDPYTVFAAAADKTEQHPLRPERHACVPPRADADLPADRDARRAHQRAHGADRLDRQLRAAVAVRDRLGEPEAAVAPA